MPKEEFLDLAPIEFYLAIKDFENVQLTSIKTNAEAIRMSTWWLVNMQAKRKINKPEKLWDHWFDAMAPPTPAMTEKQMINKMKMIAAATSKLKGKNVTTQ